MNPHIKRTILDCHHYASMRNGRCLSASYRTANTPMQWQCEHGHVWTTTFNHVRKGSWCRVCAGYSVSIAACKNEAIIRKGRCLSEHYINNTTPLNWECEYGHTWQNTWQCIHQGSWCPVCNIKVKANQDTQRGSIDNCHARALHHNGQCLSAAYINADTKYLWQCEHGHQWYATYGSVNGGSWCRTCHNIKNSLNMRNTIDGARQLAISKNGQFLSTQYSNCRVKYLWKCNGCQHEWLATYNNISNGRWCPECRLSKTERQVRDIFESLTNNKFPSRSPKWLVNPKTSGRLILDGYCEELKLAFEYDGEQHYLPVKLWGGRSGLRKIQERDLIKDQLCIQNGVTLIRVPYTEKNNLEKYIKKQLENMP